MGLRCPLLCLVRACRFTSCVVTPWGFESRRLPMRTPASSRTIHRSLLFNFPAPEKKERDKREKERKGGLPAFRVFLLLPLKAMVEQDWTLPRLRRVTYKALQKKGFMTATEPATCRVPEDPAFPAPTEGYVVTFVAFYE
jgi:hypothetical protein